MVYHARKLDKIAFLHTLVHNLTIVGIVGVL